MFVKTCVAGAIALAPSPLASADAVPPVTTNTLTAPSPFRGSFEVVPKLDCAMASGSGVRVSDDIVITAAHVASHAPCSIDGIPTEVAYNQPNADFTAMRAHLGIGYRAIVSCEGVSPGERYYAFGYAPGGKANVEPLLGTNMKSGGLTMLRGKVYPGMSGGALFNSEGAVVAIINMRHLEADWAYVLPLTSTYLCKGGAAQA